MKPENRVCSVSVRPLNLRNSRLAELVPNLAEFVKILHGLSCSWGTSRCSRLPPLNSSVHEVLLGVNVAAWEVALEVLRLSAHFPYVAWSERIKSRFPGRFCKWRLIRLQFAGCKEGHTNIEHTATCFGARIIIPGAPDK